MRKLGAGVVLIDERDGEVMYYLHELVPSIRTKFVNNDGDILEEMSFEKWDFFNSCNRIFTLNRKEGILKVEDDNFENLLKVFPYVKGDVAICNKKIRVVMPAKILLNLLERGEIPSAEFSRIKNVFGFFLPNVELGIEEKNDYGVNYYTTDLGDRTFVVIPELEVERHRDAVGDLLRQVRQDIFIIGKSVEEKTFLEYLKEAVKKAYEKNTPEEL